MADPATLTQDQRQALFSAAGHAGIAPVGYGGESNQSQSSGGNTTSPLTTQGVVQSAQQLQDFYKQQNQPVIAATEATKAPLQQRYSDLLTSIKGNQQVAENRQTLTTNNEMGRRGITGSSGLAQQEITNAVNPITQQYTQMGKDTTNQENIDIAGINKAIAQLQAGNPESSVSTATGIVNAIQQDNIQQQQLKAQQGQFAAQEALRNAQANYYNSRPELISAQAALANYKAGGGNGSPTNIYSQTNGGMTGSTGGYSQSDIDAIMQQPGGEQFLISKGLIGQRGH